MLHKLKDLFLRNRNPRQTVAKNVFWLSVGQIASRFIRAAIIIYAARVLGTEGYGVFSYALGLAGFFTIFSDIGITQILTREIAQKPDERSKYFATAFWLKLSLVLLAALLIVIAAPYFSKIQSARVLLPFVALIVIFDNLRDFSMASFRAFQRMEFEALVALVTNISIAVFGFIAFSLSHSARTFTIAYSLSSLLGFLSAAFILRNEFKKIFKEFTRKLLRPIFKSAYPIALLGLFGVFMLNLDVIMIGWWRTADEVGLYSAGQRIMQILLTLPSIFAVSLFPLASRLAANKDQSKTKDFLEKSIPILIAGALPITIGGIITAKSLFLLIFGSNYLAGTLAFQILLLTLVFSFPYYLLGDMVLAYDLQVKMKLPVISGSIANVIFNTLLIPKYGIAGSSVATVIAQICTTYFTWRIVSGAVEFRPLPNIKKTIIASLIMGAVTYALSYLGLNVILIIALSGIVYLGALYLLKDQTLREAKLVWHAIKT